jgi:hypothetical protein
MKFLENLKKHQTSILLLLFVMLLFRTCGTGSEVSRLRKEFESQNEILKSLPTKTDLQIEGLKVEKRMIQSTDRKMLDVQRQTEIEKEINNIQIK